MMTSSLTNHKTERLPHLLQSVPTIRGQADETEHDASVSRCEQRQPTS